MPVHFVYRSPAAGPAGKHAQRLEAPSLAVWFRSAWPGAVAAADKAAWVTDTLGCFWAGLAAFFQAAADRQLPPPQTPQELEALLAAHLPHQGGLLCRPGCVQALAADGPVEAACYLFDDSYLQGAPRAAAFLLHDGWELPAAAVDDWYSPEVPTRALTPSGRGVGSSYLAFLSQDARGLRDLGLPWRVAGLRLPELCGWLAAARPGGDWPPELRLLRSQVPEAGKGDRLAAALRSCTRFPISALDVGPGWDGVAEGHVDEARAEMERSLAKVPEKQRPNKLKKSLVQAAEHVAQICLHVGKESKGELYHRWMLFDDMWAAANKALANGALRYASRWDVLSAV
jgi:hypothetical protein